MKKSEKAPRHEAGGLGQNEGMILTETEISLETSVRSHLPITLVAVGAFLALPELAWYQYHWIQRVTAAQHARVELQLESALSGFARDFDREIAGARAEVEMFGRTAPGTMLPSLWRYRTSQSQLVKHVLLVEFAGARELRLLRLQSEPAPPQPASWPEGWSRLRAKLSLDLNSVAVYHNDWLVFTDESALIHSVANDLSLAATRAGVPRWTFPRRYIIVALDSSYLYQQLLPSLTQRYFHNDAQTTYHVQVRVQSGNGRVIYDSAPGRPFATASLKTIALFSGTASLKEAEYPQGGGEQIISEDGPWDLVASEEGLLVTTLINRFSAVSLAVSAVSFLVLTAALITLFVAARRARDLAQTQWGFVSGVSHELRTPLAALRSISDNLSDGLVGPNRLPLYGQLASMHVERLSEIVEDALEFSRTQSENGAAMDGRAAIAEVIDEALTAYTFTLESRGFQVVKDVPAGLPPVRCSHSVLRHSLQNLIGNAIKYGATAHWIRIVACNRGKEVLISVEDRGLGVRRNEKERIFDPFFRGRDARTSQIPGVGLGLNIVKKSMESIGGRITLESEFGRGATFTLVLPTEGYEAKDPGC